MNYKIKFRFLFLLQTFLLLFYCVNLKSQEINLPANFKERAFEHVKNLCDFGVRTTGTKNEVKAINYIKNQFKKIGLKTTVEPFEFESFEISKTTFKIAGSNYKLTQLGFNPYSGEKRYSGIAILLDPSSTQNEINEKKIWDKVVVTALPANYFQIMFQNPKLIIFVDSTDYKKIETIDNYNFDLKIEGNLKKFKSANVIGLLPCLSETKKEISICAHLDSYKTSPGADDNGSGLGVMLELASHFKDIQNHLKCDLIFLAFGAEEVGILGSRIYVIDHKKELHNCELLINLDKIGGDGGIFVETLDGVRGVPSQKGQNQFPNEFAKRPWEGLESEWRILNTDILIPFSISNHPDWFINIVNESVSELGIEINHSRNMGSDHQSFAQAGIPATSLAVSGNVVHTPEDVPSQIHLPSLEKVGMLTASIVLKTMKRL